MSLGVQIMMLGDHAVTPYTIPGTGRKYSCAASAVISVPGEDVGVLKSLGWVGGNTHIVGAGTTANRPAMKFQGHGYLDTTVGGLILWAGPVTGWLNAATGASV